MLHKLPNDLKLQDLRKLRNIWKISNLIELLSNAQFSSRHENFVNPIKNLLKKKLKFSRIALFHMKTGVCLKYFVSDCSWSSFQYGLKNSATYIPFYSNRMNIKMQINVQKKKKDSILSEGNFSIKKRTHALWWNGTSVNK